MKHTFLKLGISLLALAGVAEVAAQEQVIQLFAHRGSRFEYDENTLEAFAASYAAGLRGFETDIRMTADGELVISHDETFARLTPCTRVVETMTADEVRQVKTKQGHDLIFLPELVEFFADKDSVYIEFELKTKPESSYPEERLREYCQKVYTTVMARKPANSLYLFTSSDKRALKMMRSLYPDVDLLLIISKPICEATILEAIDMGIKRLGCRIEGTSKAMVDLAHKAGLYVSLWPGQSPEEFMLGAYLGADALNSDRAVEVKNWLDKNAPWIRYK